MNERIKGLFRALAKRGRGLKTAPPLGFIILILTNRCNLKCKTCLRGESTAQDLDPGLLDGLFTKAKRIGFNAVAFTGGEPIIHPKFGEILRIAGTHGLKLGLVTNGVRWTDYLKVLAPYAGQVNFIAVSLDSHIREINDSIRGPGTYDKAIEAVRSFKKAGYSVRISHVVNKKNYRDLADFVGFANRTVKPDAINLLGIIKTGENTDLLLNAEEKTVFHKELGKLLPRYRNLRVCISTGYYKAPFYCPSFLGLNELTVNCNGELVFCCDNTRTGATLGSLKERPLEELLREYFIRQMEIKDRAIKDVVNSENKSTHDCNYCNEILKSLTPGK